MDGCNFSMQGCDASVLLDGSASGPSEQDAPPNLSLRSQAFEIIDNLRERVHKECGSVVSCADIVALAARDSVYLVIEFCLRHKFYLERNIIYVTNYSTGGYEV